MQWRTPITLGVLLAILLGAAWYGWRTVVNPATSSGTPAASGPTTTKPTPRPTCLQTKTYPKGSTVHATSFKVNVFNAGGVSGQAGDVLTSLHGRGFQEGIAANPPSRVTATNVTILTSTPNAPMAQLVSKQFQGKVTMVPGPNLAVGVDVVIGPSFVGLKPSAPTSLTLKSDTKVCTKFAKS